MTEAKLGLPVRPCYLEQSDWKGAAGETEWTSQSSNTNEVGLELVISQLPWRIRTVELLEA